MDTIRTLLNSAVDYAGLFPPSSLGMEEAVRNYADYRAESYSWALGRFIAPASRLDELQICLNSMSPRSGGIWHLSIILGKDLKSDFETIRSFQPSVVIDSVELRSDSSAEMDRALGIFPNYTIYFEIPANEDPRELVKDIARRGGSAKVRTGGVRSDLFPTPAQLARFIVRCADRHIPWKATAGLHHALRSVHPLTYETSSASEVMHGFLNVLVGSAAAYDGCSEEKVSRILQEENKTAFRFGEEEIGWRDLNYSISRLSRMRENFFVSFGSCSFQEPLSEMKALGLL